MEGERGKRDMEEGVGGVKLEEEERWKQILNDILEDILEELT